MKRKSPTKKELQEPLKIHGSFNDVLLASAGKFKNKKKPVKK